MSDKSVTSKEEGRKPEITILPDGSACGVMRFPLPSGHWLFAESESGSEEPLCQCG